MSLTFKKTRLNYSSLAAVPGSIPDKEGIFKFLVGIGIKRNVGTESQSLVSVLKYTWVKSYTPPQLIYCEGMCTADSNRRRMRMLNLVAPWVIFDK